MKGRKKTQVLKLQLSTANLFKSLPTALGFHHPLSKTVFQSDAWTKQMSVEACFTPSSSSLTATLVQTDLDYVGTAAPTFRFPSANACTSHTKGPAPMAEHPSGLSQARFCHAAFLICWYEALVLLCSLWHHISRALVESLAARWWV